MLQRGYMKTKKRIDTSWERSKDGCQAERRKESVI